MSPGTILATALLCGSPAAFGALSFTDEAAFLAAIAGYPDAYTETFETTDAGTLVEPDDSVGPFTFTYAFDDPLRLAVSGGGTFGGDLPAPTTSGDRFLATNDGDLLVGGDDFGLTFAPANAVGLWIISAEVPEDTLFDGDLVLSAGDTEVALDLSAPLDLGDGNAGYFLGIVDDMTTFTSATLTAVTEAVGAMTFVVDDITVATNDLPLPSPLLLLASGLMLAGATRRVSPAAD